MLPGHRPLSSVRGAVFGLPSPAYAADWDMPGDVRRRVASRPTTTAIDRSTIHRMPIVCREHPESTITERGGLT
jgi:hypothetical protein